jgi:hypothetical protein
MIGGLICKSHASPEQKTKPPEGGFVGDPKGTD